MLAHWYQQIETGRADGALIESYLHGHRLAEQLVTLAGSEGDRRVSLPGSWAGRRAKKSPDHCMRWRIPAQLIGGALPRKPSGRLFAILAAMNCQQSDRV